MLGKRLAELRKINNLTQQQVANILKISRGTYGHYEIGRREPDFDTLRKLADCFDTTTDYLLGQTNDPSPMNLDKILQKIDNGEELLEEEATLLEDIYQAAVVWKKVKETGNLELFKAIKDLNPDQYTAVINVAKAMASKDEKTAAADAPAEDPVTKLPYWYMRLTALRQERGLSLEEAAEQMGHYMTPEILRSYEKGQVVPDPADQELLGEFYETNWFFISGRVNIRWGYAGETTVAIDAADNEDHPNEPLSYESRKQLRDIYAKFNLVYDLEEDAEDT